MVFLEMNTNKRQIAIHKIPKIFTVLLFFESFFETVKNDAMTQ